MTRLELYTLDSAVQERIDELSLEAQIELIYPEYLASRGMPTTKYTGHYVGFYIAKEFDRACRTLRK